MQLILIVLGFVSLVGGSQLPWMFVGIAGFLLGNFMAGMFRFNGSEWQVLTFASAAGMVGIFLSYYIRRIMVLLAGFLAGGYISITLPMVLGWKTILDDWQAFILVGSACALILFLWYYLALILVSGVLGASLIIQNLTIASVSKEAMFVVLIIFGLTAQYVLLQYSFRAEAD
jgi:hypothetical protein